MPFKKQNLKQSRSASTQDRGSISGMLRLSHQELTRGGLRRSRGAAATGKPTPSSRRHAALTAPSVLPRTVLLRAARSHDRGNETSCEVLLLFQFKTQSDRLAPKVPRLSKMNPKPQEVRRNLRECVPAAVSATPLHQSAPSTQTNSVKDLTFPPLEHLL